MPTTYNGIGTHYYGKKNRSSRSAACRSCRRMGILDSYDTRLWFVVFFIPVIPLGRKRILDQCPACSRHFVADADKYDQAKQLETSGNIDRFRRDPSPQAALEVHASLLGFHEHDQAAEFRTSALEMFPEHAELRAGLASQLDQVLEYEKGSALFEDALALDPDLPQARAGVAMRRMHAGALDEARELLDYLEEPGAGQVHPLRPLESLAHAYQAARRHEEALELAVCLLRELPEAGQMHAFRSFVRKSERALRRPESILPPREHSLRGLFRTSGSSYAPWVRNTIIGGLAVLLLAGGLGLNNWYIKTHRTIRVVNATGEPVQVAVDDGPAAVFTSEGDLTVPEGHHRLRVTGPVDETHEVDLGADFFARWFKHPVWVLNPGGEAAFDETTVYYAEQPPPSQHNLIAGQPFIAVPDVDYAFVDPPQSISSKKGAGVVTKTVFRRAPLSDQETFFELLGVNREAAARVAERQLKRKPENEAMLDNYVQSFATADPARVEAFLKSGLDRRPVSIPWHRAYQTVAEVAGHGANLVGEYDRYLAAAPGDARLMYLRGRIDPDEARQKDDYHRSIAADPKLPWPWMALGAHAGAHAEWAESIRCLRKASELGMNAELVVQPMHVARLASGEPPAASLAEEYRKERTAKPNDLNSLLFLCDALAAAGQGEQIAPEIERWIVTLPDAVRSQLGPAIRPVGSYMAGKLEQAAEQARSVHVAGGNAVLTQSLLALGRSTEADPAFEQLKGDPWTTLAVSLGLAIDGRTEDAKRWRERAAQKLGTGPSDFRSTAAILLANEPPPAADLERLMIDPSFKALTYAVLGRRFPDRKAEYDAEASRFNIRRKAPYYLVRRAIAGPGTEKP